MGWEEGWCPPRVRSSWEPGARASTCCKRHQVHRGHAGSRPARRAAAPGRPGFNHSPARHESQLRGHSSGRATAASGGGWAPRFLPALRGGCLRTPIPTHSPLLPHASRRTRTAPAQTPGTPLLRLAENFVSRPHTRTHPKPVPPGRMWRAPAGSWHCREPRHTAARYNRVLQRSEHRSHTPGPAGSAKGYGHGGAVPRPGEAALGACAWLRSRLEPRKGSWEM